MTQIEQDEATKRRVSAAMKASTAPPLADLINRPSEPERQQPTRTIVKHEATKKRVSAAMKMPIEGLAEAILASQLPPSPPSLSDKTPSPSTQTKSQVEKDEETKRRISHSMKPVPVEAPVKPSAPTQLVAPSTPNVAIKDAVQSPTSDKKPSPVPLPPSPSPDKLIAPKSSSPAASRESISVAFPKAKLGTPTRSPVLFPSSKANVEQGPSLPLIPFAADLQDNNRQQQEPTSPLLPSPRRSLSPHRKLGDKKQRVSLPNSAALATPPRHQQKARVSLPPSTHPAPKPQRLPPSGPTTTPHRLGERKQRVSLPPSAAEADFGRQLSLPASPVAASPGKHRLGERKQRVSLPPTAMQAPGAVAVLASQSSHRRLGEKKSNRLSVPNVGATEEEKEEETVAAKEVPSTKTRSAANPKDRLPRKGLRNSSSFQPVPIISGPGAFFVPAGAVEDEATSRRPSSASTESTKQESSREFSNVNDESIDLEAGNNVEVNLGSGLSTEDTDVPLTGEPTSTGSASDHEDEVQEYQAAFSSRPVSTPPRKHRSSIHRSRRSPEKSASQNDDEEQKQSKCCGCINAPWWCNIVVPLILGAAIIAVIILTAKGIKQGAAEDTSTGIQNVTLSATIAPRPIVNVFDNETTIPSFTLAAWEDPKSPQSRARDWLKADPFANGYTQARKLQRFALATLYYATNGERWKNSTNWMSYMHHECLWFTARTEIAEPAVPAQVRTIAKNLTTSPAKAITCNQDLEYEYLLLASDSLRGPIPAELSFLTSLVQMNLEGNKLTGSIPTELARLTMLKYLILSTNHLKGTIPSELGLLTNSLEKLYLRQNNLVGSIPSHLANLKQLVDLHLTDNAFNSSVPTELGQLAQLKTLRLGENALTGKIPSEIGGLKQLTLLNLGGNRLTGLLPLELTTLPSLNFLGIAKNSLSATMPTELARLSVLETFFATGGGLYGTFPSELGKVTSLIALALGANSLEQTIPTEIGQLTKLEWLYFYDNQLSGSLPSELGNLSSLKIFHAFLNQLTSTLPSEFGRLTGLTDVEMFDTEITGSFPTATCSLVAAKQLKIAADCDKMTCCAV